jgi:hypothetical protein
MTNRQHQLIMSLYARCDEINLQMEAHEANASEYIKLTGAFNELMELAKKLTDQFNAEAEALRQVESYITPKVNINA